MNILYVHNVGKIGGAERVTLDIISGLHKTEHSAFLAAPENGPFLEAASELGASAHVLQMEQPETTRPLASVRSFLRWRSFLRKNSIDLIHTGDLFVTRSLAWAANALGLPVICHMHFPLEMPALRWIFKRAPRNLHFIYCCAELHDAVGPRIGEVVKHAGHSVIHNGVDTELYKPYQPTKGLLPDDRFNVGIIANLQERKGHLDLIEAVSLIDPRPQDLLVHIIGGDIFGEERAPLLKARIEELGLKDIFVFHGQKSNVRDYLNELDLFVCASHEEAFPISNLEAMAFGLPIVSTNVNGIPEAIEDEQNGLLVAPRKPEALAAAFKKLTSNREARVRLGASARAIVEDTFSLRCFNSNISELYARYMGEGSL